MGVLQVGDLASMEPGIIPGIHDDAVLTQLRDHGLQWSSGLLPGYTRASHKPKFQTRRFNGARDHSRDTHGLHLHADDHLNASMEPGITPRMQLPYG